MKEVLISGDILIYTFIGGLLIYQHTNRKKTKLVLKKYEKTINSAIFQNKDKIFVKEKSPQLTEEEKEIFKLAELKIKENNDAIYEFYRELLRQTSPENLRNFINNISQASIKLDDHKKDKSCGFQSFYDQYTNEITLYSKTPETITHDLLHLSSNNNMVQTNGFRKYGIFENEKYEIGMGLDEGYTEVLNQRFFQPFKVKSPILTKLANLIEKFYQNPKNMESDYFNAWLENLILEMTKSMDIKDAINIILKIDYLSIHPNDKIFYHKLINELIGLYRQSHKIKETKRFTEEAKKAIVKKY